MIGSILVLMMVVSFPQRSELVIYEPPVPFERNAKLPKLIRLESEDGHRRLSTHVKLPSGEEVPVELYRLKTIAGSHIPPPKDRHAYPFSYSSPAIHFRAEPFNTNSMQDFSMGFGNYTTFSQDLNAYYRYGIIRMKSLELGEVIPCSNEGLYCFNRCHDDFCVGYLEYVDATDLAEEIQHDSWTIPNQAILKFGDPVKEEFRKPFIHTVVSIELKQIRKIGDQVSAVLEVRETHQFAEGPYLTGRNSRTTVTEQEVRIGEFLILNQLKHRIRNMVVGQKFSRMIKVTRLEEAEERKWVRVEREIPMTTKGWIEIAALPEGHPDGTDK